MATTKRGKSERNAVAEAKDLAAEKLAAVFPIVGVGASAGGIEAFTDLLRHLPESPGMAFIYVLHQEAKHVSTLPQVIARATKMPVELITDGMRVLPNRVYVVPPAAEVVLANGLLRVHGRDGAPHLPIDTLLHSLAEDQGSRAIAVILSGADADGSLGARAIKAEGGITFAQDDSARFAAMPRSATASGAIDFVLPSEEIGAELMRIARHAYVTGDLDGGRLPDQDLSKLFSLIRTTHDVDFTHYKPSTIERRIRRRMAVQKVDSLADYVTVVRESATEIEQLYSDILIRVTGFFRDPSVFEAIQKEVIPAILQNRGEGETLRVWVPGCATGEEVYSLAIAFLELGLKSGYNCPIQIFGTDVSDPAIERARNGFYAESIVNEVSSERLRQFFVRIDSAYRVSKMVRDCCIFARQNVTKDPPFSRLDLISCRNVMIYLGTPLQRKVMSIFHYALRPDGYLLLGSSESIGNYADMFAPIDRKHKIYRKRPGTSRIAVDFEVGPPPRERAEHPNAAPEAVMPANGFREADRVLLARYSPPGVLINDDLEIVQFRGRTSAFLEPAPGGASFNVLKMAREGLLADLRAAIHTAKKKEAAQRREGIRVKLDGQTISVNIEVIPFVSSGRDGVETMQLVLFEQVPSAGKKSKPEGKADKQSVRLARELDATREYLQSIIEEQEAMNEELRSANEEIQSSNEELQSTNEELETAKEELQSSNEELTTLNEELEQRNEELGQANNDLVNLLASVDIPIVMLDNALRVRRFNPGAQRTLNLIPSDIGRPITDLKTSLRLDNLGELVAEVIDKLEVREMEIQDRSGKSFLLRLRPYKTLDNKIEGAVLVLVDIDHLRK